jgi:hypothetical protein
MMQINLVKEIIIHFQNNYLLEKIENGNIKCSHMGSIISGPNLRILAPQ